MRTITKFVVALSCALAMAVVTTPSASAETWSYGESGSGRMVDNAGGMCTFDRTRTFWDILVCEVIEEIPLIYPDTNTCYLIKITPPQRNTAFRVDLTVPYATFSSTVTYEDTKPVAQLRASNYVIPNPQARSTGTNWWDVWNRANKYLPNPYEPGELIITPRDERQVSLYVTPAPLYQVTRNSGVPDCEMRNGEELCNVMGIGTREERNLIFQRVYYPLRNFPFGVRDGARFHAFSDFARFGYTLPRPITCVDPRRPDRTKRCPRFASFRDFPLIDYRMPDVERDGGQIEDIGNSEPNITIGRPTPPQPPKNCPNRQRWDRPQLFYTHWAGPGGLGPSGQNIPDPALECTGYVITLLTNAVDAVYMTRVRRPPTFVNVQECRDDRSCTVPEAGDADFKYIGIQNYGTLFGDVRYPEQSRAVGDIIKFCGVDGPKGARCQRRTDNRRYEWIFLHYTRPLRRSSFRSMIRDWAAENDVNAQQLAIYFPPPLGQTCREARENGQIRCDRHPPFLIYRNKQRDPNFEAGFIRDKVACNPAFVNPRAPRRPQRCDPDLLGSCPDGQVCVNDTGRAQGRCYIQNLWTDSNLANASDGRRPADPDATCSELDPRGCCTEDNTSQCGMGRYSPVTIRCGYGPRNVRDLNGNKVNSRLFRRPTPEFLDLCLKNLLETNPRWGFRGGMPGSNCNQPNLPEDLNGL